MAALCINVVFYVLRANDIVFCILCLMELSCGGSFFLMLHWSPGYENTVSVQGFMWPVLRMEIVL